jgi:hypothetical protein
MRLLAKHCHYTKFTHGRCYRCSQCAIMPLMSENWVMLCIGVLLVIFGFTMTAVSGAMPGAKPGYPPRLRFRIILISFGVLMSVLGAARLIHK